MKIVGLLQKFADIINEWLLRITYYPFTAAILQYLLKIFWMFHLCR